jgi:hypothetical protein
VTGHRPWNSLKHKGHRLEYSVHAETPIETTRDEEILGRFHDAIKCDARALGPSALLDDQEGTISSTFQVEAYTPHEAEQLGIAIFTAALATAGVAVPADRRWAVVEASPGGPSD